MGYVNLGYVYLQKERWADAESACRKAVHINPKSVLGWSNVGLDCVSQGNGGAARAAWEKAAALNPEDGNIRQNLERLR